MNTIQGYDIDNRFYTEINGILKDGEIFEAIISETDDEKITLKTDSGVTIRIPAENLNAKAGDTLTFQVIENKHGKMTLKMQETVTEEETVQKATGAEDYRAMLKKINVRATEENLYFAKLLSDNSIEVAIKNINDLKEITKKIDCTVNNADEHKIKELMQKGLEVEKIDLSMLAAFMFETDGNGDIESEMKEHSSEKDDKRIEKIIREHSTEENRPLRKEIITHLLDSGLPVNKKNITALETACNKMFEIRELDETTIINIVKKEKPLTLENIYIEKYAGAKESDAPALSNEIVDKLEPEIKKLFRREKIEDTVENTEIAKLLLKNQTPVTKENIEKVKFLRNIKNETDAKEILKEASQNIKSGVFPTNIDLFELKEKPAADSKELMKKYERTMAEIKEITYETIIRLTRANVPITIDSLIDMEKNGNITEDLYKDEAQVITENSEIKQPSAHKRKDFEKPVYSDDKRYRESDGSKDYKTEEETGHIHVRRQLAEIQLKLTSEAALRLSGKEIDINVMPLKEAVNELRRLESEIYEKNLKIMGAQPSPENVSKMQDLFSKMEAIAQTPNSAHSIVSDIINNNIEFNVEGMYQSSVHTKVFEDIEMYKTSPSRKYGDSFGKVDSLFSDLLSDMDIEPTEANIKAAKILSRNEIDVTPQNILNAKIIDFKIGEVFDRLHPLVAAKMIKEGLNPVDMHVDDVIEYAKQFEDELGQTSRDKLSNYILEMDNKVSFSSEDRETIIAIYRMLSTIQKHGSASVGITMKNDMDLTLGNLLEASKIFEKTRRGEDINISVDDDFGLLKEVVVPKNNIRTILNKIEEPSVEAEKKTQETNGQNTETQVPVYDKEAAFQETASGGNNRQMTERFERHEGYEAAKIKMGTPETSERTFVTDETAKKETPEATERVSVTTRAADYDRTARSPERLKQPKTYETAKTETPETPETSERASATTPATDYDRMAKSPERPKANETAKAEIPETSERPSAATPAADYERTTRSQERPKANETAKTETSETSEKVSITTPAADYDGTARSQERLKQPETYETAKTEAPETSERVSVVNHAADYEKTARSQERLKKPETYEMTKTEIPETPERVSVTTRAADYDRTARGPERSERQDAPNPPVFSGRTKNPYVNEFSYGRSAQTTHDRPENEYQESEDPINEQRIAARLNNSRNYEPVTQKYEPQIPIARLNMKPLTAHIPNRIFPGPYAGSAGFNEDRPASYAASESTESEFDSDDRRTNINHRNMPFEPIKPLNKEISPQSSFLRYSQSNFAKTVNESAEQLKNQDSPVIRETEFIKKTAAENSGDKDRHLQFPEHTTQKAALPSDANTPSGSASVKQESAALQPAQNKSGEKNGSDSGQMHQESGSKNNGQQSQSMNQGTDSNGQGSLNQNSQTSSYVDELIQKLMQIASPEKITSLLSKEKNIDETSVEALINKLKLIADSEPTETMLNEKAEQIRQLSETSPNIIKWLQKNEIPLTLNNMNQLMTMIKNPGDFSNKLSRFDKTVKENKLPFGKSIPTVKLEKLMEGKTAEEIARDIHKEVERVEELAYSIDPIDRAMLALKQAGSLKKAVKMQELLNRDENIRQIPVRLSNDEITSLNMYIMDDSRIIDGEAKDFNAVMSLATPSLGTVQINININKDIVELKINSDREGTEEFLKQLEGTLRSYISDAGFTPANIKFGTEEPKNMLKEKIFSNNIKESVKVFENNYEIVV